MDPEIVSRLLGAKQPSRRQRLTPREQEVLSLMAEDRSNQGIAERLVATRRAVQKHVSSIFDKLDPAHAVEDHRRVVAVLAHRAAGDRGLWGNLDRRT